MGKSYSMVRRNMPIEFWWETVCGDMEWFVLARDSEHWRILVN